ncbi:hypothetical protein BDAP_000910 [Binucleata daphniae]
MQQYDKNLECDDKLIKHYFSVKTTKYQHKISIQKNILDSRSFDEITVHIEEELYYNNGECLVDGFVYISKGYNDDIVIAVDERDCCNVEGYLHSARDIVKKLQSAISCKKCVTCDLEILQVKDTTNNKKMENKNHEAEHDIVDSKYLLDGFDVCNAQTNENSISNTQNTNANCTHKQENINKSLHNEKGDKIYADEKQNKNVLYDDNDNSTRNYIAKKKCVSLLPSQKYRSYRSCI